MPNPDAVTECYDCGKPWDEVTRATTTKHNRVCRLRRCVECNRQYVRQKSQEYRDRVKAGQQPLAKRDSRARDSQILGDEYAAVEKRIAEYRQIVEMAMVGKDGNAKYDIPLNHRPIW